METVVETVVTKVTETAVDSIWRQIGYIWNYGTNIQDFKEKVEKLKVERESLLRQVKEARDNGEEIEEVVSGWLTNADEAVDAAERSLQDINDTVNNRCFMGGCPNMKKRYQHSRKATKETLVLENVRGEKKFDRISYRVAVQKLVVAKDYDDIDSRTEILNDILGALKDVEATLIGVCGMGGVGKTTLVKQQVTAKVKEDGLFKVVAIANVNQNPDLYKIQQEIADWLGLKFDVESAEVRGPRLCARLKQEEKVLVILDNLWGRIKLEDIGIPYGKDHKGCKVLMTSRNRNVLGEMGVEKRFQFRLNVLQHTEAQQLFEKKVGNLKDPSLQPIAIEVAKRCAGLPILIIAVAVALKDKDLNEWKDALDRLKRFDEDEMDDQVKSALMLSYSYLKGDEIKLLFLLFAQVGPTTAFLYLLKCTVGIGLFKRATTVEDVRIRLHKLLNDLRASSLLLESRDDGNVYMHEVVYHFALSVASKDHQVFALSGSVLKRWPANHVLEQCTAISLVNCKIPKLPDVLECPKLESFLLVSSDPLPQIPDNFFRVMKKLKFLDLTRVCCSSLPLSLKYLVNLQTLCLHHSDLEDITVIKELKDLKVLSLSYSKLVRLPSEIGQLTRLQILDLSHCSSLEAIPRNVLAQLAQLEELYMDNSFAQWEGEEGDCQGNNASLAELKLLPDLVTVHMHISDEKLLPRDLFSDKLERFRIFIGDEWDWSGKFEKSRTLKLKLKTSIDLERVKVLLTRSEYLYLDDVKGVDNVLYDLDGQGFPKLKHLHVENSHEIQYIVDGTRRVNYTAFLSLESLFVDNLNNMEKICHGQLMAESFSKLRTLKLRNCNALKNLFSFSMFKGLAQLEEIDVNGCKILEEIVAEGDGIGGKDEVIELKQLHSLTLEYLPLFKSICSQVKDSNAACSEIANEEELALETSWLLFDKKIQFSSLAHLKLSLMNVEKIWPNQFIKTFPSTQCLTSMTVDGCGNLSYLFPFSMVNNLAQLKKLEISDCNVMGEIVVAKEEEEEMRSKVLFPKLEFLKLKGLPLLIRFCATNFLECPSLKVLWIENCSLLETFVISPTISDVGPSNDSGRGSSTLFDDKVSFPNMEELHILHMHKLKMIWHDELQTDSFCKLKVLKLEYGKGLLKVFSSEMFRRFRNVEELIVKNCDSLREVFDFQALIKEQDIVHFAASSQLRTLFLGGLLNLQNVWNGDPQGLLSFHNLRYIYAWNCPSLKSLFPFSISQNLPTLELLSIDGCGVEELVSKEERVEENPKFEFPQIKYLTLWRSERLRCFYSKKHVLECPLLQKLSVYLCDKLEIFASEPQDLQRMDEGKHESPWKSEVAQPLFSFKKIISNLEELSLNFKDIPLIRQGQFPVQLFRKLKVLQLQRSDDSSAKFPFHFLQEFKNLEKLILGICSFKFLFPHGIVAEEVEAFSKIRYLKLDGLYYMRQIWDQDCQPGQILRNLQTLEIWDCSSLISLAPPSVSFQNLTILDVFMCGGLSNLVSYSTAKSMVNLTSMSVRECRKVTEIVTEEGDEFLSQREIIFNKLASLRLLGLLSLTSFCSSASCIIKFPSLEEVFVSQCPSMKFFSERVSTPKLKRVYAAQGTDKWHWIGDLNTTVRYFYTEMFGFHGLQKLKLSEYPEIKEAWRHGQLLVNPFYNLTALYLDQCVHSTIAVPSDLLPLLNNLEELEVRNCNSMEQVFGVERPNASGVVGYLSKLNKLYLSDLPGLRLLWNEVLEESSGFKNLKMLKIHNCCSLRFIFTPIMCMGVMQLQELEVTSCDMLEEIVTTGFLEEETLKDTIFPLLNSITLKSLPNLTNFYSGGGIVQCPSLEKITIKKCPAISAIPFFRKPESDATDGIIEKKVFSSNLKDLHLSSLNIEKIWHAGQLDILYCFHNLTTLRVDQCDNLTYLFSSSMVKSVMHLKRLEIFYCKMMKEIIVLEGLEEEMKSKMLLPQIDFLSLNDLPKLTQFCSSDLIECPVLKELWIQKCPELIKFVSTSDSSEHKMTNSTLFDEKVAFPSLEQMTISKSDNLKIIWGNELHSNSFSKMKVLKVDNNKELLKLFPSSMLTSLQNLEDLVIRNCDSLKQVFDIKEARSTKETVAYQLAKLNVQELPNSKGLNENPQGLVLFDKLKSVSIWNCPNLKILFPRFDTQVRVVLDKLFSVVVSDCPSLEFLFTSSIARCLPQLTSLSMSNCGMKELVAKDEVAEEAPQFVYPQLKFLDLKKLKELKCFYPGIYTLECAMLEKLLVLECEKLKVFSSANSENLIGKKTESQRQIQIPESFFSFEKIIVRLKELTVNYKDIPLIGQLPVELFDKLTVLHLQGSDGDASADFPFDFIQRLKNLENLVLSSFYMKVLLPQGIAGENAEILAELLNLQLSDLPNMRHIWNHDFQPGQVLQNLQSLQILACDSLICLAPPSASFQNLVTLNVWRCRGMKSVISMSTAKSMVNLTSLSITECDMVTEIVANQGEESQYQSQNEINFNKLSYLNLHCLRSITSFCSSDSCIIKFPLLENIVVTQCPRLKVFSKGVLNAPRLKGVLAKNTMLWIGDLNTTIKHMFTEMTGFYGLHDLRLSEVPKLKEVWHSEIPVNSLDSSSDLIIGHSEPPKPKEERNGGVLVNFLHSLRNLVVDECALSPNAVPSNLLPFLNNLEELEVRNCNSVEQVCGGMECQNASGVVGNLSKLNKLQLINLPRLMFVWNEVPKGSLDFKDLRVLKVHGCSKLRHLFTPTMCLGLGQLQEVKVKYCDVVEEIITGAGEENTVDKIIFPLLNSISLESLPNLINFSSGSGIVQCPTLEVLSIVNCPANFACKILGEPEANASYETTAAKVLFPKLKYLKLSLVKFEKIWHARQWEMSHLLQNLTVWNLDGCSNLKYLLSSSMVKSLSNLKILEICNCMSMEEIIVAEEFEGRMGELFLPELNFLTLKDLPKLVHFCRSDLLECPALENLWIEECPELRTFIFNAQSSNKTAGNELEMLNSSLFDEKVVFPNLKLLLLLKVGGFKVIWSNELREDSFCKLKTLKVAFIKELQMMFPAKLVTRFQNLEWLDISCCDALQVVFDLQGLTNGKEAHAVETVPLKQLKIFNLPNLKYVWNEDPGGILEFQDLCIMDAIECPSLKCVFSNSMARNLQRLQELQVVDCAIEEIVAVAEKEVIETSAKFEFPKLTSLKLRRLHQLRRFSSGTHTLHWPVLKNLYVTQCDTVQILSSNSQSFQEQHKEKQFEIQVEHPSLSFTKIIPDLEGLALSSKDAAMICEDQFPIKFFHKLKVLELNFFDDETADFPSSVLQRFNHLETLIIAHGEFKELMPHGKLVGKEKPLIMFPKIQSLEMHHLPNLIYICLSDSQLHQILQYLETLLVENCDKLISLAPTSTSLRFLTTLKIVSCKGLISLVTSSTVKSMSQLKKLSISKCNEMKEIVSNDGDSTEDEIIFIRLEKLKLHFLPSLTSFSSGKQCLKFPSLTKVTVSQCPKFQVFSNESVSTPMLQRVTLTREKDRACWNGDLNTTIKKLFTETVGSCELPQLKAL